MSLWRIEDPVLDDTRQVVRGGMFSHQRQWWQLNNYIKMLVGGYGSGKTLSLDKRAVAVSLQNAPAPSAIVSPSYPMARRTVITTMHELLEGKERSTEGRLKYKYNTQNKEFKITMAGRNALIMVLTGDNPDALKGPNLGAAYIDEPFIQDYKVFTQMVARVRHPEAKIREIGLTGTPENLNWGWELATEGRVTPPGSEPVSDDRKMDVGLVHAQTTDNLVLPEEFLKNLESAYDGPAAEAYIKGKFVNLSMGRVFYGFNRDKHLLAVDPPVPPSAHKCAGMDFNVNPMAFCAAWHDKDAHRIHVYRDFELPNSDTPDACAVLAREAPGTKVIFPDPSGRSRSTKAPGGQSDFTHIARAGFVPIAPHEAWGLRDSYNSVNSAFKKGTITIGPRCRRLAAYLEQYSHESKNLPSQKAMSHLLDGFRYMVTYLYPDFRASATSGAMKVA